MPDPFFQSIGPKTASDLMSIGLWTDQHRGMTGLKTPYDRYIPYEPPPGYIWMGDHWENPPATAEPTVTEFYNNPFRNWGITLQSGGGTGHYGRMWQPQEARQYLLQMAAMNADPNTGAPLATPNPERAAAAASLLTPWQQFQVGLLKEDPTKGMAHEASFADRPAPSTIDLTKLNLGPGAWTARGNQVIGGTPASNALFDLMAETGGKTPAEVAPFQTQGTRGLTSATGTTNAIQNLMSASNQLWKPSVSTASPAPDINEAISSLMEAQTNLAKPKTATPTGNFGYNWSNLF